MIFSNNRDELRAMYRASWQKKLAGAPMSPLEAQIADIIDWHPEYQDHLQAAELSVEYSPERGQSNPYLHMGLHLGVREQVATNRPAGIKDIFQTLAKRLGDPHAAEHEMIECLAAALWEAQGKNAPPDEALYLESLRRLLK